MAEQTFKSAGFFDFETEISRTTSAASGVTVTESPTGTWTVTGASTLSDLQTAVQALKVVGPQDFSGDINVTVSARAAESGVDANSNLPCRHLRIHICGPSRPRRPVGSRRPCP